MSDSQKDKPSTDEQRQLGRDSTQSIDLSQSNATSGRELSDPRLVPRAMATTVADYGVPEAQELYRYFREYVNPKLFDGQLPEPLIRFGELPAKLLSKYEARDAQGVRSTITIRQSLQHNIKRAKDVLIREAISMKLAEVDRHQPETGYRGRGPHFAEECNRISKILELCYRDGTPVEWGPLGRYNKENCSHFPFFKAERTTPPSTVEKAADNSSSAPSGTTRDSDDNIAPVEALPKIESVKADINAMGMNEWLILQAHISELIENHRNEQHVG